MLKNVLGLAALAFACACSADHAALRRGGDAYADFAGLKAANSEGADYSIEQYDRGSPAVIFALHGGDIEAGTARVARRIAGSDLDLYIFQGWTGPAKSRQLHITSVHFDEPGAVRLATSSVVALSVHGQADKGDWVCVGGRNMELGRAVADKLVRAGFAAEVPCARLPGVAATNIVNRAREAGVQLEITLRLLGRLERSPEDLSKFSLAVRSAILEYLQKQGDGPAGSSEPPPDAITRTTLNNEGASR